MATKQKIAAIIGGGVIGGGWAARFLLNGWRLRVYDPDPQASRKVTEVLDNARRSLPGLYNELLPPEGSLSFVQSIEEAVTSADWIQESVPERLEIKQTVFADIQKSASATAVIASSTSGFKPSELAEGAANPGQILVAHPYNPVYLLPLVEVVRHPLSDAAIVNTAMELLASVGMKPVLIKREIDAHIGDRLLEAVWREALWLIKDDYATTEEIDDIMRYSFGIRWAQMGLFETYRTAGGEAGMEHFIAQFAPALKWPWSRLTDVPALDEKLTRKIADQSDDQSGQYSIRELERRRDNNLVAIMRALKGQNWGAGALLNQHDDMLRERDDINWDAPVETASRVVPLDWTDYNGHMNETHYLEVISKACDQMMAYLGCDSEYIDNGHSYFTVENIINYLDEAKSGDRIRVLTQIIVGAGKKLHLHHRLVSAEDRILATVEQMLIHVSLETRRSTDPVEPLTSQLEAAAAAQAALERPAGLKAGR
jgi:carnitine 3-dehydrogenase